MGTKKADSVTQDASSKILGFMYQMERALYRIFSCETDKTIIGIETADDVVEEIYLENGEVEVLFEQDKHSIQNSNQPYQNSSYNLWHTLHIWLTFMDENRKKYKEITYCLISNKKIDENTLAYELSKANSDKEISNALINLKEKGKNIINRLGDNKLKKTITEVLKHSDEELKFLVKNITLLTEIETKSARDPKSATINLLHIPTDIIQESEDIYKSILGYMIDECIKTWKSKQPVQLITQTYENLLNQEITKRKRNRFCEQPFFETAYKEYLRNNSNNNFLFIKQLCSINKTTSYNNRALENYWAFYSEKVRLEGIGDIPLKAWEEREDLLYQRWQNELVKYDFLNINDSEKISQYEQIYDNTNSTEYLAPLDKNSTYQPYFTQGHYHFLANNRENKYFIYWHDRFIKDEEF